MAVPHYPICSFIKLSVTTQLSAELADHFWGDSVDGRGVSPSSGAIAPDPSHRAASLTGAAHPLDSDLLRDLIQAALKAERHPELYQAYTTQNQARQVEQDVISEIIEAYKTIKFNQLKPFVQNLNALLP